MKFLFLSLLIPLTCFPQERNYWTSSGKLDTQRTLLIIAKTQWEREYIDSGYVVTRKWYGTEQPAVYETVYFLDDSFKRINAFYVSTPK